VLRARIYACRHGVDLVEISRVAASIERYRERFLRVCLRPGDRLLHPQTNFAESFAARFAAKEAGAKALEPAFIMGS